MKFVLSENVKVGQKIKTGKGWRKIKEVNKSGAMVKEGLIQFGSLIFGWKAK